MKRIIAMAMVFAAVCVGCEEAKKEQQGKGLPDDRGGRQDCAEIGYAGEQWNDKGGHNQYNFVCEWE